MVRSRQKSCTLCQQPEPILYRIKYDESGQLKIFKILADRYRNRRKRFGLKFNLIAGLYNYELRLAAIIISKSYD